MAWTNFTFGGFKYVRPKYASGMVLPESCIVASGYGTDLIPGDPVQAVSDGSVARLTAGSGNGVYGVIDSIEQFVGSDGLLKWGGLYLPASTTWTDPAQASRVMVIPADAAIFRCIVTGTAASIAAARSAKFSNADTVYGTSNKALSLSAAGIDFSTLATTSTLQWRIHHWQEELPVNDPTLASWTCLVYANVLSGIGGTPSNTGL